MAQREDRSGEFVEVRIPAALADRIEDVYADCRGYEPSSMQESLSVLCDVASGRLDVTAEAAADADEPAAASTVSVEPVEDAGGSASATALSEVDEERRSNVDAAFPTRWSADPAVATRLLAVVDRYVEDPEGYSEADAREADALHAVGEGEGLAPDELREQLVTALYGNTGLPDDLAGEFFSDALAAVADAEDAVEDGDGGSGVGDGSELATSPIFDDGPPTMTDGPPAVPAQPAADVDPETAFDAPTDEVTVDSLLEDEAAPTARCERCEVHHDVDDLETVIGSKSATIELLCEDCASTVEENS